MSKRRRSFDQTRASGNGMPQRPSPQPTRSRSYRDRATLLREYRFKCPCCGSSSTAVIGPSARAPVVCEVRRSCSCRIPWPDMVTHVHASLRGSHARP